MTKKEMVLEWWGNLSSAQKTQICDINTELIGRNRRHETVDDTEKELLFDAEMELNLRIFNSETQNKGTQRNPFGMWS